MNVMITGVTGLVGGGVLARTLELPRYKKIYVLLRPGRQGTAQDRLHDLLKDIFAPEKLSLAKQKVVAVSGDMTADDLGIDSQTRRHLIENLDQIVHCSASTKFDEPIEDLRNTNREGTRRLLELAKVARYHGRFKRFDFVSTAYVAGDKPGYVSEDDLERGQTFSNNYEQSKYETERVARTYREHFPVTIMRPSIIVGQASNGYTPHFRVLYWPLKLIARKLIFIIPCRKHAFLDVVPADYVNDGVTALIQTDQSLNGTYYLASGRGNEITVGQLLDDAHAAGAISWRPKIPMWSFRAIEHSPLRYLFPKSFWDMCEKAAPYASYLLGTGVRYNVAKSHALLEQLGVRLPKWHEYREKIFTFAMNTDWGKGQSLPNYAYLEQPVRLQSSKDRGRQDHIRTVEIPKLSGIRQL